MGCEATEDGAGEAVGGIGQSLVGFAMEPGFHSEGNGKH